MKREGIKVGKRWIFDKFSSKSRSKSVICTTWGHKIWGL